MRAALALLTTAAAGAAAKCTDGEGGKSGDGPGQLAADCAKCFQQQQARGCAAPKFCAEITGTPWCGPASIKCDEDVHGNPTPSATSAADCAALGPSPGPSPPPPGPPAPTPPKPPQPSPSGKCGDFEIDTKTTTPAALVGACETCWDKQTAAGCGTPEFCSRTTGMPWCGSAANTFCDDGANGVSVSRECCGKYTDHSIAWRCGGLPCPNAQAQAATPQACETCFEQAAAINCSAATKTNGKYPGPAFCTSTLYGSLPWCGPSDQAEYCQGTFVTKASDCSSVGPGPAPPGPQPTGSFSQTHCTDANCSTKCQTESHPQGQCLGLNPSGSAVASCTDLGLTLKVFTSSDCTGASQAQVDPVGVCLTDGQGGSFENKCSASPATAHPLRRVFRTVARH